MAAIEEKAIHQTLSLSIALSERILEAVKEAGSLQLECVEVGRQVDRLSAMLRYTLRFASAGGPFYEPPVRRIVAVVCRTLERALALIRRCRRSRSFFSRLVTIVSLTEFRKLQNLLDASLGDMKWLLSILDHEGIVLSLPPIASNDPILSWVWSYIASVHMGELNDRIEAANELASLARDNDRNKKIIVKEGGILPLLKLLKESSSPEAQISAAMALCDLANDQKRVQLIVDELGVPIIVQVLGDSPMKVQIWVAHLVARMSEHYTLAQEDFARENVIRPLVTFLSFETFEDDSKPQLGKQSILSIVQINKEIEKNPLAMPNPRPYLSSSKSFYSDSSTRGGQYRKERENERPEVKLQLKISCAKALWMLAKGSVSNSRRITETKGLLCLAKLVENEQGELQYNCLMTIMEIAAAAESNADLRRATFKTNSAAAKAAVDQLLRVITDSDSASMRIGAIKAIGSLAHTFPARETRVIGPVVEQLSHMNHDVATEAIITLGKFACPENYLSQEHSKTIIKFNALPMLMRLLRSKGQAQLQGLILLCYLAVHAGKSEALEQARVRTALEGADRSVLARHPNMKALASNAIYQLNLYHAGAHPHRNSYAT